MKILIPGGHLTPALGLIDWLQEHQPDVEIVFAGRVYSQEFLKQRAIEAYEIDKRSVKFLPVKTVKFDKNNLLSWLVKPFTFSLSVYRAFKILNHEQPQVIMSFGGYVAVPFVIAAKIKQIPVLAHEGTRVVGLANKIIFKFAQKIAYTYEDLANFDLLKIKNKAVLTGTPLRLIISKSDQAKKPEWLQNYQNQKLLLVLGGNQGSKALNDFISENLEELTKQFIIVHQCGRPNKLYNYPQELAIVAETKKIKPDQYYIFPWIDEEDLLWLYQQASLSLSRAGANTIEELTFHAVPSILIPLPSSHYSEQLKNARHLADKKAAILLTQDKLSLSSFIQAVEDILKNRKQFVKQLQLIQQQKPATPAEKLFSLLTEIALP